MQAQYGTRQTGKRLATLKKYKKEPHDSFSTITQTEHLASLHTPLLVSPWMYMLLISLVWCSLLALILFIIVKNIDILKLKVESLKWEKLEERMLYKIKNGLIDIDSHQYIQSNDSRTRGKDRLYQERTSSEAFGNSFLLPI
jgi:hypothetical protein